VKTFAAPLLIFLFILGCSGSKHFTNEGEKLYYDKCSGCHRVYQKSELNAEKWKEKLNEMAPHAKLKNEEKEIILKFLLNN
jgi:trimethylamine-N-oxide reductase (cytochrome c)